LPEFKPETGFEFTFTGGTKEQQYIHLCKVTEAIPMQKLTYSWRYDGYEGKSYVSFELFEEGDKTKLVLTHTGLETFPSLKDFARESFEKGWNHIIGISLPKYIDSI